VISSATAGQPPPRTTIRATMALVMGRHGAEAERRKGIGDRLVG
jgi:hypothetical protein